VTVATKGFQFKYHGALKMAANSWSKRT